MLYMLYDIILPEPSCYELKPLELDNRTTLVLSNIRKLDRDLFTNQSTFYTTTNMLQQLLTGIALVVCLLQQSSQLAIQQWELQKNLTRSLRCIDPLYILQASDLCYNNNYLPLYPCIILISYYLSTCVFLQATMLPTCALTSYS